MQLSLGAEIEEINTCKQCTLLGEDEQCLLRSMIGELELVSASLAELSEEYVEVMSAHESIHQSETLKRSLAVVVPAFLHTPLISTASSVLAEKIKQFKCTIRKSLLGCFLDKGGVLGLYIGENDDNDNQDNISELRKMISKKRMALCESTREISASVSGSIANFYHFVTMDDS